MGSSKGSSTTVQNTTQTVTPQPTEAERQMQEIQLGQYKQTAQPQTNLQLQALQLAGQLIGGSTNLPGFYGQIASGMQLPEMQDTGDLNAADYQISQQGAEGLASRAVRGLLPKFQSLGVGDSGLASDIAARTAGDIFANVEGANKQTALGVAQANQARRMGLQEFNINAQQSRQAFNLGNLFNLLNLAVGGQAQVQQPVIANSQILSNQLQGLRPITTTGQQTATTKTKNPFLTGQDVMSGIGTGVGMYAALCWVAKEIFGSWEHPKTIAARYYIRNLAPKWFKDFYLKYGERIAKFISNKPLLKLLLRPLFEYFANKGNVALGLNIVFK